MKNWVVLFLFFLGFVSGAPLISDVDRGFENEVNVVINGVDFGEKVDAAPVVWDDCSGDDVFDLWDGGWPDPIYQPSSSPRYALSGSIGGVESAHSHVSNYLAMRAYDASGSGQGFAGDPMVWKRKAEAVMPFYMYVTWYQRVHPNFDSGDNFKWFDYSGGNNPYDSSGNWYLEYVGGLGGSNHINDNAAGIFQQQCDGNWGRDYLCNSWYFGGSVNPINEWVKMEVMIYVTDQNDGWIDLYENGVHKLNLASMGTGTHSYNGPTDSTISSSSRNFGIGGYTRTRSEDNWRFFNDLYLDYSLAHVIIGDNSVYDSCTVKEVQIPTVWSDGSISVDVNQGSFEDGETAYLFVVDEFGEVSDGFEVVISGEVSGCVDGATVGCSTGLDGICSSGLRICVDGVYGECVQDNVSVVEICGDGIDQDCDGSDLVCEDFVVDHTSAQQFDSIPESWIQAAKDNLHIVYQHTSHGSQLVSGMNALENYVDYGGLYEWSDGGDAGLDLDDVGIPGASDLGYEDAWPVATRTLLDNPTNSHVNVVLWSWCNIAGHDIPKYLADMDSLILEYPDVDFVYITGHANGGGEGDSSDSQNELIRAHVAANGGMLFDFADFENYDPDDNYFLDLNVQDDLDYNGGNWASEYLDRYTGSDYESLTDLVSSCAHSDVNGDSKLNCVLKGQGVWYLFARLAGWDGSSGCVDDDEDGFCLGDDCDDSNELVYPGAEEVCGDGIDQDCVGGDLVCDFHDADLDRDGEVSLSELEGYIGIWLGGEKTISEVMQAVTAWMTTR